MVTGGGGGAVRAVLLDLDGTLVDSVDLHARAWHDAFQHFGVDVRFGDVRAQIGKGGDQLMPVFLPVGEVERIGEALSAFRDDLFRRVYRERARPFPRARELVERLRTEGRSVALASSGSAEDVAYFRRLVGLDGLLDGGATTSDDAERSKPHPDIFEAALARTGARADEAIAVGDSPWDAKSADRAGLRTIGLLSGGFAERDLRDAGCVAIYRDPADLLAGYEASPLAA
jgi:HAD superfamily hydrolase (TIGR01509 family)